MAKKGISVIKASGEKDIYDVTKLRHSLQRSGATDWAVDRIVEAIDPILYEGITTREIYNKAYAHLRKHSRSTAARYKLKRAIYDLGPTGYPFEKFVGALLHHQGFETQVGIIVKGHCVTHEVDVVAEKDNRHFMVECKFHSDQGRFCNVKIPLYIHSRFKDIEKQWKKRPGHETKFHQGWIFTNTRFTSDAIQYGSCAGLMLVGWNYPAKGSLNEMIDTSGLHPVTCLTTLTMHEKQQLLLNNLVLCKDLCQHPELLHVIGVDPKRVKNILTEARELCSLGSFKFEK